MKIHFISGLPRSGSTLLAAILRQNPSVHAAMSSPLSDVFLSALRSMSLSDTALFMDDQQRARILGAICEAYYWRFGRETLIFDTSRVWTAHVATLGKLFPEARVICCIRNPAWIVDSVERLVQRNSLLVPRMFGPECTTVYARAESLMKNGFINIPLHSLLQAWHGDEACRLIAVHYDSLTERPRETMRRLYDALGEKYYSHDFENVEYDEPEFDARMNMPGLHRVARRVRPNQRPSILPPDLFAQFDNCFWKSSSPALNAAVLI
jgi:sulfotransferase